MIIDPTQRMNDAHGENAVLYLAGEGDAGHLEATLGDPTMRSMLTDLRTVDLALRAAAASDSPSAGEFRRTRDASIRMVRSQGAALISAGVARRNVRSRQIPRWSIAAAAAVVAVVGVVGWMSSSAPVSLPAKPVTDDSLAQNDRRGDPREQWFQDWQDYANLVPAFNAVDAPSNDATVGTPDSLDDGDTQVDALTMLSTMSQD